MPMEFLSKFMLNINWLEATFILFLIYITLHKLNIEFSKLVSGYEGLKLYIITY